MKGSYSNLSFASDEKSRNGLSIRSVMIDVDESDNLYDVDNYEDSRVELRATGHNLVSNGVWNSNIEIVFGTTNISIYSLFY